MSPPADTADDDGPRPGHPAAGPGVEKKVPPIDRKMLDDIFGDVLPDTTTDERGPGGPGGYSEEWYLENRPPHHGG